MKNIIKIKSVFRTAGIIALAAVIAFSITACNDDSSPSTDSDPTVPQNVRVTHTTENSITLEWDAVSDASHYFLHVFLTDNDAASEDYYDYIKTPSTSGTMTELHPNATYYFRISAVASDGEGKMSSSVSAETQAINITAAPNTPQGVMAIGTSTTSVYICWNAASGARSYNVYRYSGANADHKSSIAHFNNIESTSYTWTGLSQHTPYYFGVTAENPEGSSGYSSIVSVTTLATNNSPSINVGEKYLGYMPSGSNNMQYLKISLASNTTYNIKWWDSDNTPIIQYTDIEVGLRKESAELYLQEIVDNHDIIPINQFTYTVPPGEAGDYLVVVHNRKNKKAGLYELQVDSN